MDNAPQVEYKIGHSFGFNMLPTFTFRLTRELGNGLFTTLDNDGVEGRISTGEIRRAILENKIYLKNGKNT